MGSLDHYAQSTAAVPVEVFEPPSREARWLLGKLGPVVAPQGEQRSLLSRMISFFVIAPFTQFTVVSFDLQLFLFNVFHTSLGARLGHGLFMPFVNFFVMVALAQFRVGDHPAMHGWVGPSLNGATVYAAFLLTWYFLIAASQRLYLWWALTVPFVLALALGADAYYCHTFTLDAAERAWFAPTPLVFSPFIWMAVGAFIIAASHGAEPNLPPRVIDQWRWVPLRESILGTREAPHSPLKVLARLGIVVTQLTTGAVNEWWASPRLMPYNLLALMLRAGYNPDLAAKAKSHADRAIASGNPALDYVGIGGGTFLSSDGDRVPSDLPSSVPDSSF